MDHAQKRWEVEMSIRKPTMTEDDGRNLEERKAHELQIMIERADMALEGNRNLLGKRRAEMGRKKSRNER